MKNLVQDFSGHRLIPGSVLSSILGDPKTRESYPLDYAALLAFNQNRTAEIITQFRTSGLITEEQAGQILTLDGSYLTAFVAVSEKFPEISRATECDETAVQRLALALFS